MFLPATLLLCAIGLARCQENVDIFKTLVESGLTHHEAFSDALDSLPALDPLIASDNPFGWQFKKCAVVGSSGINLGSNSGDEIDAHDTVFRVNWAPTDNYAKDVGYATDVAVVDATLAEMEHDFSRLRAQFTDRNMLVLIHGEENGRAFAHEKQIYETQSVAEPDRILALSHKFAVLAGEIITFEQKILGFGDQLCAPVAENDNLCRASTGFLAVLLATLLCKEQVSLYGFAGVRLNVPPLYYEPAPRLEHALLNMLQPSGDVVDWETGVQEKQVEFQLLEKMVRGRFSDELVEWRSALHNGNTHFPKVSLHMGKFSVAKAATHGNLATPPPRESFEERLQQIVGQQPAGNADTHTVADTSHHKAPATNTGKYAEPEYHLPALPARDRAKASAEDTFSSLAAPGLRGKKLEKAITMMHRMEKDLKKKFGLRDEDVRRLQRYEAGITSRNSLLTTESLTSNDEPPIQFPNSIHIPTNPMEYFNATDEYTAKMLAEATTEAERRAATTNYWKYKLHRSDNTYIKSSRLGSGTYGTAYLCWPDANNTYPDWIQREFIDAKRPLVIKVLKSGHKKSLIPREVLLLLRLRRVPYAVQLLDVVRVGRTHTGLVFPYTNNTYYRDAFPQLSPSEVRDWLFKTLTALDGAHARGVMHMDIKPINVFYDRASGELQLGDWGLGIFFRNDSHHSWRTMTMYWKAPEVFLNARSYSYAVDMWSMGVCFAGMLTGRFHFFDGKGMYGIAQQWIEHLGTDAWEAFLAKYNFVIDPRWSRVFTPRRLMPVNWLSLIKNENRHMITIEGLDLAARMLRFDPAERISARDALRHPYFASHQATHLSAAEMQQQAKQLAMREQAGVGAYPDPYEAWQQKRKHGVIVHAASAEARLEQQRAERPSALELRDEDSQKAPKEAKHLAHVLAAARGE